MYESYRDWAKANGYALLNNGNFAQRLTSLGIRGVKPDNVKLYPVPIKGSFEMPIPTFAKMPHIASPAG